MSGINGSRPSCSAAVASAAVLPLYRGLLGQWSALGRGAWLLGGTLGLFGVASLLVWPLRTWPGPGGGWPWGVAALLTAGFALHKR